MSVRVEVWSDIACPWCWVGKRHLESAANRFGAPIEVSWRAFELDPRASRQAPSTVDYVERLAAKYRTQREVARQMIDRMVQVGAAVGLDFRFDRVRPGNTFDAHRLMCWAEQQQGTREPMAERLFAAYLTEGRALTDRDVLAELAAECGLDADAARAALGRDDYAQQVRREERDAVALGVTGVPHFVFGGRYAVSGAQPPELLLQILQRAESEQSESEPERWSDEAGATAAACSPDGCD